MGARSSMPEPAPAGPEYFGDYQLLSRIGAGGMGEVHLALQRTGSGTFRRVALKRILPRDADDNESVRMFLIEMRLVGQLQHPHIAHTYDFGMVDGHYFIAMEYVDGISLSKLIAHRRPSGLPLEYALKIAIDTCSALHHAHEQRDEKGELLGVVHRDVSPQNVLVSEEGSVKLVDFGIARVPGWTQALRTHTIKGKASYMAPEQASAAPCVDRRADVFAVGTLLYEMVTGTSAFGGTSFVDTLLALQTAHPPPMKRLRPDVPATLETIVDKALRKSADERYQTAAELQLEIEKCAARHGIVTSAVLLADGVKQARGAIAPPPMPADLVLTRVQEVGVAPIAPPAPEPEIEPVSVSVSDFRVPAVPLPTPLPTARKPHARRTLLAAIAGVSLAVLAAGIVVTRWNQERERPVHSASERPDPARDVAAPSPTASKASPERAAVSAALPPPAPIVEPPSDPVRPAAERPRAPRRAAAPTPPTAGATGRLLLVSVPDANVRFHGQTICDTPCTTPPLPAGRQVLVLTVRDGRRFTRTVTVPSNETGRLRLVLE